MRKQVNDLIKEIKEDIQKQKELLNHLENNNFNMYVFHSSGIKKNLKILMDDLRYYSTKHKETDYVNIGYIEPGEILS